LFLKAKFTIVEMREIFYCCLYDKDQYDIFSEY